MSEKDLDEMIDEIAKTVEQEVMDEIIKGVNTLQLSVDGKHITDLLEHPYLNMRSTCFKCGVSWPYEAPELRCTCAPNEGEILDEKDFFML